MDKKPMICFDGHCKKNVPICCFDCEQFDTCPDACIDEKCRGEDEERKRKMGENTVDVKGTIAASTVYESIMVKSKKADAKSAFERLTFARETLDNYEAMTKKTNNSDVSGELLATYMDLEVNLKLIIVLEQKLILNGK